MRSRSMPDGAALPGTIESTRSRMVPISANSGSGYSTTATSLSSSGGITSTGESRKTVLVVSFKFARDRAGTTPPRDSWCTDADRTKDEDRALILLRFEDELERLERIVRVALLLGADADALGDRPGVDLGFEVAPLVGGGLLAIGEHAADRLLDPFLLGREQIDERVARPHEVLDVLVDAAKLGLARDLFSDLFGLSGEGQRGRTSWLTVLASGLGEHARSGERICLGRCHGGPGRLTR